MLVTKDLPGTRWLDILVAANLRVEVCAHEDVILSQSTIKALMNDGCRQCHGVIGQLTEVRPLKHAHTCHSVSLTQPVASPGSHGFGEPWHALRVVVCVMQNVVAMHT